MSTDPDVMVVAGLSYRRRGVYRITFSRTLLDDRPAVAHAREQAVHSARHHGWTFAPGTDPETRIVTDAVFNLAAILVEGYTSPDYLPPAVRPLPLPPPSRWQRLLRRIRSR